MLKLWGRPTSGRTQKVLWTLEEIGLKFDFILASATMGRDGSVAKGNTPFGVVNHPNTARRTRTAALLLDKGLIQGSGAAAVTDPTARKYRRRIGRYMARAAASYDKL